MTEARGFDIEVDGSILTIVPAVHYRVAFAEAVNTIACNAEARPDAIAVEMGPAAAAATGRWLREIGVGPQRRVTLPCLLGLQARARYLSPSVRERALELQVEWARELVDIPPEVLELELDYRASSLIALSPTDSIVEAVRCGCELDVPVHGVDLEEFAPVARERALIPDASGASGRVTAYSAEVAALLDIEDVPLVDRRRELAMAARLKALLQSHGRVLFTCGLAHWQRVAELVRDPGFGPARVDGDGSEAAGRYRRKVIDPTLAFQFLDCLPLVAWLYERRRRHPRSPGCGRDSEPVPVARVFDAKVRQSVRVYLKESDREQANEAHTAAEVTTLAEFPRLVTTYGALGLREAPHAWGVVRCAKAFVGNRFASSVARNLLRFPWASPEDFHECDWLSPAEPRPGDPSAIVLKRGRVLEKSVEVAGLDEVEWLGVADKPDQGSRHDDAPKRRRGFGQSHTWTPWERLASGLSDEAVGIAMRTEAPLAPEPFRGSLEGGIAQRETLRSQARGESDIYVYGRRRQDSHVCADMTDGWPVVWIFDRGPAAASEWRELGLPLWWMTPLARDRAAFERSFAAYARMAAIIAFGDRQVGLESEISILRLRGLLLFSPVFAEIVQFTRWVEMTGGRRNAWVGGLGLSQLPLCMTAHCEAQGHPVGDLAWQDDIVRMAIPFSRTRVTFVVPSGLELHPAVAEEATRMGRRLERVGLDRFRASEIERMRTKQCVPGHMNGRRTEYPARVARILGEPEHRYADRMPPKWSRFGR